MFSVNSRVELVENPDFAVIHSSPNNYGAKFQKAYIVFGVLHILFGITSAILEIYLITINLEQRYKYYPYLAIGLWLGATYILAGFFGIVSGIKPEYITIIAGMLFGLTACLLSLMGCLLELIACVAAKDIEYGPKGTVSAIHITLVVISAIEFVLGGVHCGLAGNAVCCVSNPHIYEKRSLYLAQTTHPTNYMYPTSPAYEEVFHTNFGQPKFEAPEEEKNEYQEKEENHTQL